MTTTQTTELSPADALALIREGKPVSNATVRGLTLEGDFEQKVVFQNAVLRQFKVQRAKLKQGLNLQACEIHRAQIGEEVVIEGDLDLRGCRLHHFEIKKAELKGGLRLENVKTTGAFRVNASTIHGLVKTWMAHFGGWAEFTHTRFLGKADFRSLNAEEGFVATDCRFEDEFWFRGSSVAKKVEFSRSHFSSLTDFSKAKLRDTVYLETIEQGPKQRFAFGNALFDRVLVRVAQLEGHLATEEKGEHLDAAEEYGLLKKNFSNLNRYDAEDWAFYRFKVNKRRALPGRRFLTRLFSFWVLDIGCGYGARPFRAVFTAAVLMLIFAGVFAAGIPHFDVADPPIAELALEHPVNRALFGLMTSVSVFTSGFGGEHLQNAHGWVLAPLAIEALLGTLLWGLFIVAFSRKVIR